MQVDFGKKAPPSATKKVKVEIATGKEVVETDASQERGLKVVASKKPKKKATVVAPGEGGETRSSVVGVAIIEGADLAEQRLGGALAEELTDVLATEQESAAPMEQLPDDSDFKIEYNFEEVEVAVGEKPEELVEEVLIDDSGAVVGRFAVPVGRFWLVAFGMLFSTMLLSMLLYVLLQTATMNKDKQEHKRPQNLDQPGVMYMEVSDAEPQDATGALGPAVATSVEVSRRLVSAGVSRLLRGLRAANVDGAVDAEWESVS